MAGCSKKHAKHTSALCGQNVEFVDAKPGDSTRRNHAALVLLTPLLVTAVFFRDLVTVVDAKFLPCEAMT
jgi:hypothetical protein